jgi:hypothetical protein
VPRAALSRRHQWILRMEEARSERQAEAGSVDDNFETPSQSRKKSGTRRAVRVLTVRGWQQRFEDSIPLPGGRPRGCREVHHKACEGTARSAGVANGDGSIDACREAQRPDNDGADRRHESAEPPRRSPVQSRSPRPSLGKAEIEAGRIVSALQQLFCSFDGTAVLIRRSSLANARLQSPGRKGLFSKARILSPGGRRILPGGPFIRHHNAGGLRLAPSLLIPDAQLIAVVGLSGDGFRLRQSLWLTGALAVAIARSGSNRSRPPRKDRSAQLTTPTRSSCRPRCP